jgi:hypothetical protein
MLCDLCVASPIEQLPRVSEFPACRVGIAGTRIFIGHEQSRSAAAARCTTRAHQRPGVSVPEAGTSTKDQAQAPVHVSWGDTSDASRILTTILTATGNHITTYCTCSYRNCHNRNPRRKAEQRGLSCGLSKKYNDNDKHDNDNPRGAPKKTKNESDVYLAIDKSGRYVLFLKYFF